MTCFGPFFVLLNTSHPGFFISMHVCCYAPRDLMGQGETVLQGECTVTCPKGHSIRFDGNALPRRCANTFKNTFM